MSHVGERRRMLSSDEYSEGGAGGVNDSAPEVTENPDPSCTNRSGT